MFNLITSVFCGFGRRPGNLYSRSKVFATWLTECKKNETKMRCGSLEKYVTLFTFKALTKDSATRIHNCTFFNKTVKLNLK